MIEDRYYLRHKIGDHWWNLPWTAYRTYPGQPNEWPNGTALNIAVTRKGALRCIKRDRILRAKNVKAGDFEIEVISNA